jgi:hypothetical protein
VLSVASCVPCCFCDVFYALPTSIYLTREKIHRPKTFKAARAPKYPRVSVPPMCKLDQFQVSEMTSQRLQRARRARSRGLGDRWPAFGEIDAGC